jgi:S-(hydroxymethyl)glutathione dehydrogenase/alcohol dehydrogenase
MKAAVLREIGKPLQIEDVQLDMPGPNEVLIRTAATGLCHSDLHLIEGAWQIPLPAVLGHESAGVVEAVGSQVHTVKPGDHVITCLSVFCGHCRHCVTGRLHLCRSEETKRAPDEVSRMSLGGQPMQQSMNLSAFAEQLLVHENAVVAVRKDMPLDCAALIGCAVMTGYGAVVHSAGVRPGDTVAIIGCGGVGLSTINSAAIAGAGRIIALDIVREKEKLAREFGATDFVCAADGDPVQTVVELTLGGVDHAFECIGLARTAEQAVAMLSMGGTATILGVMPEGEEFRVSGALLLLERRIHGSFLGSNQFPVDMPRLVDFYMKGHLKLDQLISRRLRLDQINEGFAEMKTGAVARSVIVFDA